MQREKDDKIEKQNELLRSLGVNTNDMRQMGEFIKSIREVLKILEPIGNLGGYTHTEVTTIAVDRMPSRIEATRNTGKYGNPTFSALPREEQISKLIDDGVLRRFVPSPKPVPLIGHEQRREETLKKLEDDGIIFRGLHPPSSSSSYSSSNDAKLHETYKNLRVAIASTGDIFPIKTPFPVGSDTVMDLKRSIERLLTRDNNMDVKFQDMVLVINGQIMIDETVVLASTHLESGQTIEVRFRQTGHGLIIGGQTHYL